VYPLNTSEKQAVCGYIYYSCVNVIKFLDLQEKVAVIQPPHANFKTKRMSRVFCFNENGRLIDRQRVICVQFKARVVMGKDCNLGDQIISLPTACSWTFGDSSPRFSVGAFCVIFCFYCIFYTSSFSLLLILIFLKHGVKTTNYKPHDVVYRLFYMALPI
jgi:hypothetical protein